MRELAKRINEALSPHYTQGEVGALARILATELLGISQTTYYLKDDVTLTPAHEVRLTDALARLQKEEPIQYILGYCDFCDLRFGVNPAVLIPRPETSELVYRIAQEAGDAKSILDIGTGSGCIAVSLANLLPHTNVTAWDISPAALEVARENSHANGCNVRFEQRDILTYTPATEQFDIIVSNPPYIKEAEKATMENNVLLWEPHIALFVPDDTPLLFYRAIAAKALTMLTRGGKLYFEINREHGAEIIAMLQQMGYCDTILIKDFADNDRMIRAVKG